MAETVKDIIRYYQRLAKGGRSEPDFFEFVRRIESVEGRHEVGRSTERAHEPMRFGQMPHLNYAESAIAEIVDRALPGVFVNFFGLWGPNGPMPLELTGYVYRRMHNHGDNAPRRFADIVNHRFLGLYYRAWKAVEQAALFDKPGGGLVAKVSSALAGEPCRGTHLSSYDAARWSGLFGVASKSRDGLTTLLRSALKLPVVIRDGLESEGKIPSESRCRLGRSGVAELGVSTQLGSRFRTRTRQFSIEIRSLTYRQALELFPGLPGYRRICELVQCYLDRPLDWELCLVVKTDTVPATSLSGKCQLGRSVFLGRPQGGVQRTVIGASRLAAAEKRRQYSRI